MNDDKPGHASANANKCNKSSFARRVIVVDIFPRILAGHQNVLNLGTPSGFGTTLGPAKMHETSI